MMGNSVDVLSLHMIPTVAMMIVVATVVVAPAAMPAVVAVPMAVRDDIVKNMPNVVTLSKGR